MAGWSCGAANVCYQEVERQNIQGGMKVLQKSEQTELQRILCEPKLCKRRATEDLLVDSKTGVYVCISIKICQKRYTTIRCILLLVLDMSRQQETIL